MPIITWNPDDKGTGVTLSNNNLTAQISNNSYSVRATHGKTSGKWYWEITYDNDSNSDFEILFVGIANENAPVNAISYSTSDVRLYYAYNGNKFPDNVVYGNLFAPGDVIGIALDLDNGTIEFFKNGISQGIAYSDLLSLGTIYPFITNGSSTNYVTATANFGAMSFQYSIPEGFSALEPKLLNNFQSLASIRHFSKFQSLASIQSTPIDTELNSLIDILNPLDTPKYFYHNATYISSNTDQENTNFSQEETIKIGNNNYGLFHIPINKDIGYVRKALLTFDLLSISTPGTLDISRIISPDWTEDTVTYATPTLSYDSANKITIDFNETAGNNKTIDITDIMKQIYDETYDRGFMIYSQDTFIEIEKINVMLLMYYGGTEIIKPDEIFPDRVRIRWKPIKIEESSNYKKTYVLRSTTPLSSFDATKVIFETTDINVTEYIDDPPSTGVDYYYYVFIEQPDYDYYIVDGEVTPVREVLDITYNETCDTGDNFTNVDADLLEFSGGYLQRKNNLITLDLVNDKNNTKSIS